MRGVEERAGHMCTAPTGRRVDALGGGDTNVIDLNVFFSVCDTHIRYYGLERILRFPNETGRATPHDTM